MKDSIKVAGLCLLLKSSNGLCINIAHVTEHSKSRTPVGAGRHCRKRVQTAPGRTAATVVHCRHRSRQVPCFRGQLITSSSKCATLSKWISNRISKAQLNWGGGFTLHFGPLTKKNVFSDYQKQLHDKQIKNYFYDLNKMRKNEIKFCTHCILCQAEAQ